MTDTDSATLPARTEGPRILGLRPDRMPRPIEKAAIILTAIGPDLAAGFLRDISEADMTRFADAIGGLGRISQEVLDAVVVEFLEALTSGPELTGGMKTARALLGSVMDEDDVTRLLGGPAPVSTRSVWERMNDAPQAALADFMAAQHPQAAAVILTEMNAEIAAGILETLDRDFAQDVVLRLSRVPTLDMAIRAGIMGAIDREFLSVLQRNMSRRRPADLIAGLMDNISTEARDGFLAHLTAQEPSLAREVQRTMFTFEDIATRLSGKDVSAVIRDVPEDELLKALKYGEAAGSPSVAFVIENLPKRLGERFVEDMAALEAVSAKDGEAAQLTLSKAVQAQVRAGAITLIDKDEDEG